MTRRVLAALIAAAWASTAVSAPVSYHYTATGKNAVTFEFVQADAKTPGAFRDFEADLTLDDKNPAAGKLTVRVKVASLDTGDEERDGILREADLFDVKRYAVATFTSTRIVRAKGGYQALGKLTIRDVTRDFAVPFALRADGHMTGAATLRRLDFGVGQGEWESTEWVGNDVKVMFDLRPSARVRGSSSGEQPRGIPERLELERVAGGIVEEHRGLLADLAREADVGLDHEARAGLPQTRRQTMPGVPGEHDPEMRDRNFVPVHRIEVRRGAMPGIEVRHELMPEEVEIHPVIRAAALRTTEEFSIETARGREVVNRDREVKGLKRRLSAHECAAGPKCCELAAARTAAASSSGSIGFTTCAR
jgi:polyisoprenoid-binding protein YceI